MNRLKIFLTLLLAGSLFQPLQADFAALRSSLKPFLGIIAGIVWKNVVLGRKPDASVEARAIIDAQLQLNGFNPKTVKVKVAESDEELAAIDWPENVIIIGKNVHAHLKKIPSLNDLNNIDRGGIDHEIGHIKNKHTIKKICHLSALSAVLTVFSYAKKTTKSTRLQSLFDYGETAACLATIPFFVWRSRKDEQEADQHACEQALSPQALREMAKEYDEYENYRANNINTLAKKIGWPFGKTAATIWYEYIKDPTHPSHRSRATAFRAYADAWEKTGKRP